MPKPTVVDADEPGLALGVSVLASGGLVAFPTETVYGLGANALDAAAAASIFAAKQRPKFDPLIVHVADASHLGSVTSAVPLVALELAEAFWPGPLTMILPKAPGVPGVVTAGLDTVAVRVPSHSVAHRLLAMCGHPIAAPSANPFGRISPTRAQHVIDGLGQAVDVVIDGGPCRYGVESTIVDVSNDRPCVLRLGAVALEDITRVVPDLVDGTVGGHATNVPGSQPSHYAPRTPFFVFDREDVTADRNAVYIAFSTTPKGDFAEVRILSEHGDLLTAASRLFDVMHELDQARPTSIIAEYVPDEGIGRAINDRLRRAAAT